MTNQNAIQEEIKSRLKSNNVRNHTVRNISFYILLSRNTKIKVYRTVILSVVLYGCATWSLTVREEHKLRVCQNGVLRTIYVPNRDKVKGELIKLHNEELNDLYCSLNIFE